MPDPAQYDDPVGIIYSGELAAFHEIDPETGTLVCDPAGTINNALIERETARDWDLIPCSEARCRNSRV